ncbi:class I glutamine amidotransferase-like protein [Collybia nuda]|uniref:Class I glutamine amidotransferase-like protein n=1 Tax=Collybia nuda TaxID=64659 RepID=A0A9P5XZS7_9AGAR|nr:class I glutamine amidotransferase-like protein [Collybia nuda]
MSTSMKTLQIGVMLESVQLSDIVGMDILGSISKEYFDFANTSFPIPKHFFALAHPMKFHYIASSLSEPAFMTPSLNFKPTVTYEDCPRDLDILLIGGPLPTHRPAAADVFMKEAVEKTEVIMSVCIGGLWLADAGVLKGKNATTNREALELAKKTHPEVEWKDEKWVVDGKFWTAGGAGCGVDMIVEYMRSGRFDKEMVEYTLKGLQFGVGERASRFYKD